MVNKEIPYAVYCRKSLDDEDKQVQSIPRQVEACMKHAKELGLTVLKKPKNFQGLFECDLDYLKEEKDDVSQAIYKKYVNYFIVKERSSAYKTGRKKRRRLLNMVNNGQVKGILIYDPDRASRNMLEAGELLDMVDKGKVDLCFKTFDFQNNSNGKMMLTMLFGFAKHYSDHRSDYTHAGNDESLKRGLAMGRSKYGYLINKEGRFEPHPEYFPLMKVAFNMKLYEKKIDAEIAERLHLNGFKKWIAVGKSNPLYGKKECMLEDVTKNALNRVWKDSFYYGMFTYGTGREATDQRELNPDYVQMITEDEFKLLESMRRGGGRTKRGKKLIPELEKCYPFVGGLVTYKGEVLTPNLPNRHRRNKDLEKALKINPNTELYQVVKPNHIYYNGRVKLTKGKTEKISITADIIIDAFAKKLKSFRVTDDNFAEYKNAALARQHHENRAYTKQKSSISGLISKKKEALDDTLFQQSISPNKLSKKQLKAFNNRIKKMEDEIHHLETNLINIEGMKRKYLKESIMFTDLMSKAVQHWDKATYVQQARIAQILCSNIEITAQKVVRIYVKEGLKPLFSRNVSPPRFERRSNP